MAQLASVATAGYYPTPPSVVARIAAWLQVTPGAPGVRRLLDPCAGTGAALAQLGAHLAGETYGIEVNTARAAAAQAVLDRVLTTSAHTARVASGAFALLFLNPPYDITPSGSTHRREEHTFLVTQTPTLLPDGVLVYLIPQQRLAGSARYLATHYHTLRVFRFPDPEFAAFDQIVVFGRKRRRGQLDLDTLERLRQAAASPLPVVPAQPAAGERYRVPSLPAGPVRFTGEHLDPAQLVAEVTQTGGAWRTGLVRDLLAPPPAVPLRPLMPLRRGHRAATLAAGLFNHVVLAAPEAVAGAAPLLTTAGRLDGPVIITGRSTKVRREISRTTDADGTVSITEREHLQTTVTALDRQGVLHQLGTGPALVAFLERYQAPLQALIRRHYPPRYTATDRTAFAGVLTSLLRPPLRAQADLIRAAATSILATGVGGIIAEMGSGKTLMGAAVAACVMTTLNARHQPNRPRRVLVLCPPHLVEKTVREIHQTLPGAGARILRTPADVRQALANRETPLLFLVLSRETAKLGAYTRAATGSRRRPDGTDEPVCPGCGALVELAPAELTRKRRRCARCAEPLWQSSARRLPAALHGRFRWSDEPTAPVAGRPGSPHHPRRVPLMTVLTRLARGQLDLTIIDEYPEMHAGHSAQAWAAGAAIRLTGRVLVLTGTLFGGRASSLFHLLYLLSPRVRQRYGYHDRARWIDHYGIWEWTRQERPEVLGYGAASRRVELASQPRERPGLAPAALTYVLDHVGFLRLLDVAPDLPAYTEVVQAFDLDPTELPAGPLPQLDGLDEDDATDERDAGEQDEASDEPATEAAVMLAANGPARTLVPTAACPLMDSAAEPPPARLSQARGYRLLETRLVAAVRALLQAGSRRLLAAYLQAVLAYPDACPRGELVRDRQTRQVLAAVPTLPADRLYPKEVALRDLALAERARGRRVLVYVSNTGRRDLTPRLSHLLTTAGLRVAVLKSQTVPSAAREAWLGARLAAGLDCLVVNPNCVKTGLDLIAFPTIWWHQPDYSVATVRQASRRSWRLGQTAPVTVYYAVYRGTMQHTALGLIGRKLNAALQVDGEIAEEGLAGGATDGDDIVQALARALVEAQPAAGSLEALFAQAPVVGTPEAVVWADEDGVSAADQAGPTAGRRALAPAPTIGLTASERTEPSEQSLPVAPWRSIALPPTATARPVQLSLWALLDAPAGTPAAQSPPPPAGPLRQRGLWEEPDPAPPATPPV